MAGTSTATEVSLSEPKDMDAPCGRSVSNSLTTTGNKHDGCAISSLTPHLSNFLFSDYSYIIVVLILRRHLGDRILLLHYITKFS